MYKGMGGGSLDIVGFEGADLCFLNVAAIVVGDGHVVEQPVVGHYDQLVVLLVEAEGLYLFVDFDLRGAPLRVEVLR